MSSSSSDFGASLAAEWGLTVEEIARQREMPLDFGVEENPEWQAHVDSLCPYCHSLDEEYYLNASSSMIEIGDLDESAQSGNCEACATILDWVTKLAVDNMGKVRRVFLIFSRTLSLEIFFRHETREWWEDFDLHNLPNVNMNPIFKNIIKTMPELSGNAESDSSFAWILEKIQECESFHQCCVKQAGPSLPTRVLDLESLASSAQGEAITPSLVADIRLYEPGPRAFDRYICLSHCWGKTNLMVRTTSDTIESHKKRIIWSTLPKTFQDAIVMTRKLKIRYLWIDSLCIVQDDEKDWFQEAKKMCDVYSGSYLTLSATVAPDCSYGLFVDAMQNQKTDPRSQNLGLGVYARRRLDHPQFSTSQATDRYPLLQRGWVYQERLLSKRVLHFGAPELYWECCGGLRCECSGIENDPQRDDADFGLELVGFPTIAPPNPKKDHVESLNSDSDIKVTHRWQEVVQEYSVLSLTFEKDRLPALCGLATQFEPFKHGNYIAGLWEDSMMLDLLWTAIEPNVFVELTHVPSWSWASVKGGVRYDFLANIMEDRQGEEFELLAEVQSVPVHPKHGTFDQSSLGELRLSGYFVVVKQLSEEECIEFGPQLRPGDAIYKRWHNICTPNSKNPIPVEPDYNWYSEGPRKITGTDQLVLLLMASDFYNFRCLLLKKLEGKSDKFARIGIVEMSDNEGYSSAWDRKRSMRSTSTCQRKLPKAFEGVSNKLQVCII